MIDERVIDGLREYLKDHYVPSDYKPAVSAMFFDALAMPSEIEAEDVIEEAARCEKCLRDIPDEVNALLFAIGIEPLSRE